ncbi:MAG: UDP-N-acetylmuramoyl-L-alanine--D-glutamate ligase [Trueperaceae bacterium]
MTDAATREMPVLLYGLGRSGLAAGRLLERQGRTPVWFDRDEDGPDQREAVRSGWRRVRDPLETGATVCIAAPGVPIDHADLVALRAAGTETIGEVEWVHRTVDAPIVAVTGTAGKGAVTRWTQALLRAAGLPAEAGGNLDPALAAVATPGRWLVTEMSSFQLERCPTLHPRVAVVTVLGRDHLDRHGTVTAYHALKRRLLAHLGPDDVAVLNADDPHQQGWDRDLSARVVHVSVDGRPVHARQEGDRFRLGDDDLGPVRALATEGRHHRANLLAAAAAAEAVGAPVPAIRDAIPTLRGQPGRNETIAERCGVRFVEDSIATRELAVDAALEAATPPIVWIVGGRDKGADPRTVAARLPGRVLHLIGIGESGADVVDALADLTSGHAIDDANGRVLMRRAVTDGAARLRAAGGGTLLLAPLAASFDRFSDHADRGAAFRVAVAELLKGDPWTACS